MRGRMDQYGEFGDRWRGQAIKTKGKIQEKR
jgi:hypothetical protein